MREFTEEVGIELLKGFKAIMDDSIKKFLNNFRNDLKVVQERVPVGFNQACEESDKSSLVTDFAEPIVQVSTMEASTITESLNSEGCEELNKAKDGEVMMEDESMETNGGWRSSVALSLVEHSDESIQDLFGQSRATTRNDMGNIGLNQVIFFVYPNRATMDVELVMNYTYFVDTNREVHRYEREDAQLEKLGRTGLTRLLETKTRLTWVLIAAVERKCNMFNVNYGEPTLLPNYGHLVDLVNEAVDKNYLTFVSSAGNSRLALSTIGTPSSIYSSLAGVGAYVFSTMSISAYSIVESFALHFESWGYLNRKMHCFGLGSEFLWQQLSFETLNLKESPVLVETCRVLIFVQESEDIVRLFAGKIYSSNHSLVAYRLNWFLNACIQAIHQNINELEDKLLRTTEKSAASTTFLLQALPFVLDIKVSWAKTICVALSLPECSFGMDIDIVPGTTILISIMDSSNEEIYMVGEAVMITEKEKGSIKLKLFQYWKGLTVGTSIVIGQQRMLVAKMTRKAMGLKA
ncbi:hypothetical protein GQ457_08G034350 [Hibiscus cannabinus]